MDLTRVDGTYCKELRKNCWRIKSYLEDPQVSTKDMIEFIDYLIEPSFIEAEAKQRFRTNLHNCSTKEEVDKLCSAAVVHGMYYKGRKKSVKW